ncbi:heavy-metal-associated domain-containing protein [Pollutimonas sp. M17]|uniref:heavy-metal-associated domain-containing protein n=1 Tax=Pollutimonas sp. M17 TaxID=2962065 RepID=UPI0021F3C9F3|nr:heavy-metal-associated domain-containing protein [Pollutimonas sp. M17]UYO92878.1 heavy-metal-associated domain-containing protein [Pollutimonas sp. M17]HWK70892.1 heavy-metal-associated domain-containing protein [Burkholderiaceae bacterium]
MIEFDVQDMTCGHCAGTITAAVQKTAPGATVDIDLASHSVRVDGAADAGLVERTIREAGYTPQLKSR